MFVLWRGVLCGPPSVCAVAWGASHTATAVRVTACSARSVPVQCGTATSLSFALDYCLSRAPGWPQTIVRRWNLFLATHPYCVDPWPTVPSSATDPVPPSITTPVTVSLCGHSLGGVIAFDVYNKRARQLPPHLAVRNIFCLGR